MASNQGENLPASAAICESLGIESVPSPVGALGQKRFLFVTGKGGVGKTTVCASLALALAKQGKRVLVAMCNTKERLSAMLGTAPIEEEIVELHRAASGKGGVWAVNISPDAAIAEHGANVLKVKALTAAVFDSKMMRTFFRAVPGLYEWAMLGKAWFHTTETRSDGSFAYDVVLLDAPATGHGLDMLRVPKVILDIVPPGILRRDAEKAWELFRDRDKSGVIAVTLAEELPVTETIELCTAIDKELGLPLQQLFVNAVVDPLFSSDARAALVGIDDLLDPRAPREAKTPADGAVVAGARRALRERVQEESVRRLLAALKLPAAILPHLYDEASTPKGTQRLAAHLGAATIDGRA